MPSLGSHDPLKIGNVSRERITEIRDLLSTAPVEVDGVFVDCSEKDERRVMDTLAAWDSLSVDGVVSWIFADDSEKSLTKSELESLLVGLRRERALRESRLHKRARELKSQLPDVTERDLVPENWE